MLLNWKGAEPRCRFCKRSNHLIKDCRNLKRKIEKNNIEKLELLAKNAKIETEKQIKQSVYNKDLIETNPELNIKQNENVNTSKDMNENTSIIPIIENILNIGKN